MEEQINQSHWFRLLLILFLSLPISLAGIFLIDKEL